MKHIEEETRAMHFGNKITSNGKAKDFLNTSSSSD
jgi:hypothetical protein